MPFSRMQSEQLLLRIFIYFVGPGRVRARTVLLQDPVIILIQQDKGSHLPGVFFTAQDWRSLWWRPMDSGRRLFSHGFVLCSFAQIIHQATEHAGRKVAGPFLDSDTGLKNREKEDLSVRGWGDGGRIAHPMGPSWQNYFWESPDSLKSFT